MLETRKKLLTFMTALILCSVTLISSINVYAEAGNDYDDDYFDPSYYDVLPDDSETSNDIVFKTIEDYNVYELEEFANELFNYFNEYRASNGLTKLVWDNEQYERSKEQSEYNILNSSSEQGALQLSIRREKLTPEECYESAIQMGFNDSLLLDEELTSMAVYACEYKFGGVYDGFNSVVASFGKSNTPELSKPSFSALIIGGSAIVLVIVIFTIGYIIRKKKNNPGYN